jgi:hypothetical protein
MENDNGAITPSALERAEELIGGGTGKQRQAEMLARFYVTLDDQLLELQSIRLGNCKTLGDPAPGPMGPRVEDPDGEVEEGDRKYLSFKQREEQLAAGIQALHDENEKIWHIVEEKVPLARAEADQARQRDLATP